jgi:hypothetical protein
VVGIEIQGPLDCHIWQGATSPRGYPVRRVNGRVVQVRRLVYERERRPLLPGERVKMQCGERRCVWAAHMSATPR